MRTVPAQRYDLVVVCRFENEQTADDFARLGGQAPLAGSQQVEMGKHDDPPLDGAPDRIAELGEHAPDEAATGPVGPVPLAARLFGMLLAGVIIASTVAGLVSRLAG